MTATLGPLFSIFMQKFKKKKQCPREAKEVCPQFLGCVFAGTWQWTPGCGCRWGLCP